MEAVQKKTYYLPSFRLHYFSFTTFVIKLNQWKKKHCLLINQHLLLVAE